MSVMALAEVRPVVRGGRCVYCSGAGVVPCSKRCRIRYLLDHWEDVFSPPGVTSTSGSSSGLGLPLLPGMSRHHSVVELGRCLGVLGLESPVQLAHLKAYRCAEWRVRVDRVVKRRPRSAGGKTRFEPVVLRSRERIVPSWVRLEKVRLAESRLAELFRGGVEIPEELMDSLVLSADEIEAKERKRRRLREAS